MKLERHLVYLSDGSSRHHCGVAPLLIDPTRRSRHNNSGVGGIERRQSPLLWTVHHGLRRPSHAARRWGGQCAGAGKPRRHRTWHRRVPLNETSFTKTLNSLKTTVARAYVSKHNKVNVDQRSLKVILSTSSWRCFCPNKRIR